ncbi:MAG: hypothetical protein ABI321_24740 [Polyangia bacterium]
MSTSRHLKGLVLGTLLAFGCSTPSVPVPPPTVDVASLSLQMPVSGQLVMTGKPSTYHDSAQFFITDRDNGDGVITTAASDGSFTTAAFMAAVGDTIKVQYTTPDGTQSVASCVKVVVDGPLVGEACQ